MTVSLIRNAESHTGTTGSVSEASYTFALGQAGDSPKGVLVFAMSYGAADLSTAVTYGGTSLSRVTGGMAADTATEQGRVAAWFLGSSVPSGAQNVVVTRSNNANPSYSVAFLLGGAADLTNAVTPVLQQENAAGAAQTIDPGTTTSIVLAGLYTGSATAPGASTSMTLAQTLSGTYAYAFGAAYETTPTTGSRSRGCTSGNDDLAHVILAISEVQTAELAFGSEAKSAVVTAGTKTAGGVTYELALASESKSAVVAGGSVTHAVWELDIASESKSAVVVAGSVTEAGGTTHDLALTSEAKSAVAVAGSNGAYVIAFIDDLHCSSGNETANNAVRAIVDAINPDALAVGGDVANAVSGDYTAATYGYGDTWGTYLNDVAYAEPGNHDFIAGISSFDSCFSSSPGGTLATDQGHRYYVKEVVVGATTWRLYYLEIAGNSTSAMRTWLAADLAAHPGQPVLAMAHYPRFSCCADSGYTTADMATHVAATFQILWDARADIMLSGHIHIYARWPKMDPDGYADSSGIRCIGGPGTQGSGKRYGAGGLPASGVAPTSYNDNATENNRIGYVKVTLQAGQYKWAYYVTPTTGGSTLTDSGTETLNVSGSRTWGLALASEAKSAVEVTGGKAGGGTPAAYVGATSNTSAVDTPSSGPMGLSASATGRASGDLLIVEVTESSTSRYFSAVTGWTCQGGSIGSAPVVSGNHGGWLFTRVADGTSADDFDASLSGTTNWAAAMVALHGQLDAVGTPHVDHPTAPTGGGTTSSEATHDISVTTSVNDCVVAVFCGIDSSAARSFTSWDGLTERLDFGVASAGYIYLGAATGSEASAGAKTYTVTPSSTEWGIGWAVSIKGIAGTTYELALTSEAKSAVVVTGSVVEAGVIHELALQSESKSATVVTGSVQHAVLEMALSSEATSAVTVAGSVVHQTLELALSSEALSAVVVVGQVAESGVTHELALTSESKSAIAVAGSLTHAVWEMALSSEAVSAVTVAGSVQHVTHELALTSEAKSAVTVAGGVVHQTLELALASEAKSAVTAAGSVTHATWELALTSEAKSAVAVVGQEAGLHELALTSEAKSAVAVAGAVTHATWELALASEAVSAINVTGQKQGAQTHELALASEAKSAITAAGTVAHAVWELALASEAVSNITVAGTAAHVTYELAFASESVSSVVVAGSAAHQTLEMSLTSEAKSAVVVTGTRSHAVWELELSSEAVSNTTVAGTVVHVTWDLALASEAKSSITVVGQKNGVFTQELELASEALSRVVVTGTRGIAKDIVFSVGSPTSAWTLRGPTSGWEAAAPESAWRPSIIEQGNWEVREPESGWPMKKPR